MDMAETRKMINPWTLADKEHISSGIPDPTEHQPERRSADFVKHSEKALLEKLHLKYYHKPWIETLKLVRYCLDKPSGYAIKSFPDHPVLKCKNTLQEAVKAKSLSTLITRIEAISKQKGLESHLAPSGKICYITSEMFYIEVQVKRNGHVGFVKLAHHGESPTVCNELLQLLRAKDFDGFGRGLEGLLSMYNIPGSSEMKAKVYQALCSLEADLMKIYNLSRPSNDKERVLAILEGNVGYLSPRYGGTPMNIEYYISPYQVLEEKLKPGTRVVGTNVSVTVVGLKHWFSLQICTLFHEVPQESGSSYRLSELTEDSKMNLPACFVLAFAHPEPILLSLIEKIQNITGLRAVAASQAPLHKLLIDRQLKQAAMHEETQFVVSLPDSVDHCYVLNNGSKNEGAVMGALMYKIPFTHPSHVPSILEILRSQAVYNTLLSSCLSSKITPQDHTNMLHFEVSLQENGCICISFQYPSDGDLSCVEVEVLSPTKLTCILYTSSSDLQLRCDQEFIRKVLERCMSIPITMRTILRKAQKEEASQEMETLCTNREELPSQDSGEIQSSILSDPTPKQESPSHLEKNVVHGSVYDPSDELYPEEHGIMQCVESDGPSSCPAQDMNSSYAENETSTSLAEVSCATVGEEPNAITLQALSPIPVAVSSPKMAEHPSSSLTEELSSSVTEELSLSVSALDMSRSVPEDEIEECY